MSCSMYITAENTAVSLRNLIRTLYFCSHPAACVNVDLPIETQKQIVFLSVGLLRRTKPLKPHLKVDLLTLAACMPLGPYSLHGSNFLLIKLSPESRGTPFSITELVVISGADWNDVNRNDRNWFSCFFVFCFFVFCFFLQLNSSRHEKNHSHHTTSSTSRTT